MTIELALRSTAILAAAWLLARMFPRAAAATRHLIWHAAFIAIVLAPALGTIAPTFALPGIATVVQTVQEIQLVQRSPGVTPTESLHGPIAPVAPAPQAPSTPAPLSPVVAMMWAASGVIAALGTLALSVWFGAGWVAAARRVRRASAPPADWQLEVNALCVKLRLAREVRLAIMPEPGSPLATGLWRAAILLPRSAFAWSADRRQAVLLHELAHIQRGDCRVQLLTHAGCALYWFNPLVWMAASHLRSERERACDDAVLRSGAQASSYAAHLLDIARELQPVWKPSAALAMARVAELEGRLLAVLANRARVPSRASRWGVTSVLALTTIVALGAVPARPAGQQNLPIASRRGFVVMPDLLGGGDRVASAQARAAAEAALESSPNAEERQRAAIDLAQTGNSASIGPLQEALNDSSQDVREKAALALAFMSGREVVPALLTALRDRDSQVREKAAIGLALRRDPRVIEPLLAAMQDPDGQVREKVAIALGTSGDPRARAALNAALRDPDAQVREKAAAALVLLGFTQ